MSPPLMSKSRPFMRHIDSAVYSNAYTAYRTEIPTKINIKPAPLDCFSMSLLNYVIL